jgi:hypothetical protein
MSIGETESGSGEIFTKGKIAAATKLRERGRKHEESGGLRPET